MRRSTLQIRKIYLAFCILFFTLIAFDLAFSQPDSAQVTNPAFDSLIRHIADSLFRGMEKAVPPIQNVQEKTGVATQRDVVNFSDIAKQDSLNRIKSVKGKPIHSPLNPVEQWYKRTLDSLRKAFDTTHINTSPPVDSTWQDTTAQQQKKTKVLPRELKKNSPSLEQKNTTSEQPKANLSPPPDRNFSALEDDNSGIIPPDVNGAAGPAHLMVTLNTQVRIQDRQGTVISTVSLENWWAGLGATTVFDPKVLFDPYSRRWIFTACSNPESPNSSVLIAVSQTDNPTGPWNRYRFDADPQNTLWADYLSIGFNKKWICLSVNMFGIGSGEVVGGF